MLVLLYAPLLLLAAFSFNDSIILSLPFKGFTTRWYTEAFDDPRMRTRADELDLDRHDHHADLPGARARSRPSP